MRRILTAAFVSSLLAAVATPARAANNLLFDGNMLWNNAQTVGSPLPFSSASGPCVSVPGGTYSVTQLGTVYMTHNRTDRDPMLVDPYNVASPRWDPQQLSPANCKYAGDAVVMTVPDPWFEQTNYVGAVPYRLADPNSDWTTGWTYYNITGAGRTDINYSKPVVILEGQYNTSMTLTNTNNYLLRGRVGFSAGATLTIPAGTYLFGEKATVGFLVIERGARIMALGTKTQPVVLTSDQTPGSMTPGDNGGLVIHGRAVANCLATPADSCVSEGGAGYFGGSNDADDSGVLRYMRVEYAGKVISPDNELNSFTFNAVGTGTTADFLEAFLGTDDAFEWFGGTGRAKHLIAAGQEDDGLDWQLGWRGFVQFAVVRQYVLTGDKGIEADNSEFNFGATPFSSPQLCNLTLVGTNPPNAGLGSTNRGIHLRRGTAGGILNSIIIGFRGPGLDISDNETFANCPGTPPAVFCQGTITAIEEEQSLDRGRIHMAASPNPTSSSTNILFALPGDRHDVRAQIFDVNGRLVETLAQGPMNRGTHFIRWAPKNLPTGSYFFRLTTEDGQAVNTKLILVR